MMPKFKSHKTVEQIAKKHRLDVSFIQKQLNMGEPIEHEHTKDHELAMDIALQHLDEIPDYYTRLKKMEADAKKHHKKFKDVKEETKSGDEGLHDWFGKSKSSDGKRGWVQLGGKWAGKPCARQPGQTSTPKCGSSKIASNLSPEEEERARRRKNIQDPNQPQKTGAAKPTNVRTEEMDLQEVKDKPGKGSGKKDACYNKVKSRYDVWPSAYASGALVKCRKVGAANWGTKSEETMHEEERYCPLCNKRETKSECSYGEKAWDKVSVKDQEYSMVRSELETLMNAAQRIKAKVGKGEGNIEAWVQSKITKAADYIDTAADYIASGEMEEQKLVDKIKNEVLDEKCWPGYKRKKGTAQFAPGSCVKAENVTIEDADGNTFAEVIDLIQPEPIKGFKSQVDEATRLQAQTGNVIAVTLSWRGKYYSMKMFFPQLKTPSRTEINDELQKVYPGSVVVYHSVSEIQPGQPLIQAFGPQGGSSAKPGSNKNYVKTMGEEVEIDEDWQKVNRQDRTSGLSPAAVKAYRRENPGSKLQTAVTEKNPEGKRAKRRASFCSRMKGMKSKLTSAETSRDPDSNINKALRRWNCN
jgi:ribosomal protein S24E